MLPNCLLRSSPAFNLSRKRIFFGRNCESDENIKTEEWAHGGRGERKAISAQANLNRRLVTIRETHKTQALAASEASKIKKQFLFTAAPSIMTRPGHSPGLVDPSSERKVILQSG